MDLRQLRYFVAIVQAGSLSRAADQLNVAQSAISHHLAGLEAELAKQLVTRGPKGIVLTDAGSVLYRHAEAILRHVEFARQDAMNTHSVPSGNVAVGFPSALAAILGYELFMRVREAYPQIRLRMVDGKSALIRELLDNGRLDLAILFAPQPERGLECEPLLLEELFFTTVGDATGPITLAEVVKKPLIMPGTGSGIMHVLKEAITSNRLTMTTLGDIETLAVVRQVILSGVANSILPWAALYQEGRESKIVRRRVTDVQLARSVALCSSGVAQRSPAFDAVASTIKTMIRDLVESGTWKGVSLIASAEASVSSVPVA